MAFIGKWTFGQGTNFVHIDPTSGVLSLAPLGTDRSERFNAYGSTDALPLQGANGRYVLWDGTRYVASGAAPADGHRFRLEDDGAGGIRMVDLGAGGTGATHYYWNANGTALDRVAMDAAPPATTSFAQTVITPGIDTILAEGFSSAQPDLIWVDIAGTDFTSATSVIDFTYSRLDHADLSGAIFESGTGFDQCVAPYARFVGAWLVECSFGTVDCRFADFSRARMNGVQADNADFSDAVLNGAVWRDASNLAHAKFVRAKCIGVDFTDTANIVDTDFTGADLTGAVFTGASVTGKMTLAGANLTDAALNNPNGVTIYPNNIVVDSNTNFTRAKLQNIDFSNYTLSRMLFTGADMTGCNFHGASLNGAELSYCRLDRAAFTGTVLLNGANLSNAQAKGADFTNAQFGALSSLFVVPKTSPDYALLYDGLTHGNTAAVAQVFAKYGYTLSGTITTNQSRFVDTMWTVQATAPTQQNYAVLQQMIAAAEVLGVYLPTAPAVLSNAFLVNAIFTGANMIGVNASGASIYGIAGSKPNLNSALLQDAQFSNANLSNADFSSASLGGVNFDYAVLTNAVYQNTKISTSGTGTRASFVGANLQNANFDGATIANANFSNAALSVANPASTTRSAGVWLFEVAQDWMSLIVPELDAAASGQFTLVNQALSQLQTPGAVGTGIVAAFAKQGITLTSDAVLSITGSGIYWKVTENTPEYAIYQSYDPSISAAALGVSTGTGYSTSPQFFLPLSVQPYLKNGVVDPRVVAAFAAAGHPISATAKIVIAQYFTDWQIINGAPDYRVYSLWLSVIAGAGTRITVRPAIPNLISIFNAASVALSTRATVKTLNTNNGWSLNNESDNPYNPVVNYITFNLIRPTATDPIETYGAVLRIARMNASGALEYYNIPAGITVIAQSQLQAPGNVCPNGDFSTTNVINGLPFAEWLRARVAPRPPRCVPDPNGMASCPL